jgi:chromate transporter
MTSDPAGQSVASRIEPIQNARVSLARLSLILFKIGATTFGGLWAGTQKLERELVIKRGWMTVDDQKALMVAATLIPAPKFLAFGGMVGFRLRGWPGSIVALFSIMAPPALCVLAGAIVLNPGVLGGPMPTLTRTVAVGVIGLLFGNAIHQIRSSRVTPRQRTIGIVLGASVAVSAVLGVPLIFSALAGLALGVWLIRPGQESES